MPLYASSRVYQQSLASALSRAGFEVVAERAVFVRQLAVRVPERALVAVRAPNPGRLRQIKVVTMAQSPQPVPGPRVVSDDLDALLAVLPARIRLPLSNGDQPTDLLEVVMDLGREPEARYPGREVILSRKWSSWPT